MKILLLGDYSNYHACLGQALAQEGHQVTVASDGGGWMKTDKTISLSRPIPGKAGGFLLFSKMVFDRRLFGFDVVSLISPSFVQLKAPRLRYLFDKLKRKNGSVFLGSIGTDKAVMDFLKLPDCPLRYSEFYSSPGKVYESNREELAKNSLWQQGSIGDFCEYVYDNVDGVTTALYEYHLAMQRIIPEEKLEYVGIPVNPQLKRSKSKDDTVHIFLGRHSKRKKIKGTDRLEIAANRVVKEFPDKCELTIVEDEPYKVYIENLRKADIILDQLYSYTPATNALLAMSSGQTVVSGAEPEFYDFIGEKDLRPIINVVPDDELIYQSIRDAVINDGIRLQASVQGPKFIEKHNEAGVVAKRHLDFWTSKI